MKNNDNILMGIKRTASRSQTSYSGGKAELEYKKIRPQIFKRDSNRCTHCGDTYSQYQEIHHEDDDHTNNSARNLSCICVLCHLCHHIGFAGLNDSHTIIYLPEISQGKLNSMVRSLWLTRRAGSSAQAEKAAMILSSLKARASIAESMIKTSSPLSVARHLASLSDSEYKERGKYLKDLRVLFDEAPFSNQMAHWEETLKTNKPKETWLELGEKL